ncbi:polycystin-1-like protein 2 [Antedon mediterranea]|uniref:polycystin-1-like protein 2 n=1 Tax=Antedon mediterranea TaxID=105859 RepID=UPI003AF99936
MITDFVSNRSSFIHTFHESGSYNITMTKSGNDISQRQILVLKPISGITIVEGPRVDVLETKRFTISLSNIGYDSCIFIDFGNGEKVRYGNEVCSPYTMVPRAGELTNVVDVATVCQHNGSFNLQIFGFDKFSYERVSLIYAIIPETVECNVPTVNIFNHHADPLIPRKIELSQDIVIVAELIVDCQVFNNEKSWTIEEVSPRTGLAIEGTLQTVNAINFGNNLVGSDDTLTLVLRKNSLRIGHYRFIITVAMESGRSNGLDISAFQTEYVEVVASSLQVKLLEGSSTYITVGYGDTLNFFPQDLSKDPDVLPQEEQTFDSFAYYCRRAEETFNVTEDGELDAHITADIPSTTALATAENEHFPGCFGTGPGKLLFEAGTIALNTSFMRPNLDYVLVVEVRKDTRIGKASIGISIKEGNFILPLINLNGKSSTVDGILRLNPSTDVRASCNVVGETVQFTWTLARKKGNDITYQDINDVSLYTKGKNEYSFFISKRLLLLNYEYTDYRISLSVFAPISQRSGNTTVEFTINLPPSGGVCSLSPREITVSNRVLVNCTGWTDVQQYSYSMKTSNNSNIRRSLTSGQEPLQTIYPLEGDSETDYLVDIWVNIKNQYGVSIEYMVDKIQVRPLELDVEQTDKILQDLMNTSQTEKLRAEGNWQDISEYTLRNMGLLNSIEQVQASNESKSAEEQEEDRKASTNLRAHYLNLLSNVSVPPSTEALSIQLSAFITVTEKPEEINQASIGLVLTTTKTLTDQIHYIEDDADETELVNSVTQAMAVVSNALQASSLAFSSELRNESDPNQAKTQVAELEALFDDLGVIVLNGRGLHEPPIIIETPTITAKMQRGAATSISDEPIEAGGGIFIVPSCQTMVGHEKCSDRNAIDFQVKTMSTNPFNFDDSVSRLSNDSLVVSLAFKTEGGNEHNISDISEPIEIMIPRSGSQTILWQNVTAEPIKEKFRVYHRVDIENTDTAISIEFQPYCANTTYEISLAHNDYPDTENNIFIKSINAETQGYIHKIFITSSIIGNHTGVFYLGVAEFKEEEDDGAHSSSSSSVFEQEVPMYISETFTCNYSVRIYLSGCNFWSKEKNTWTSEGCVVGKDTSFTYTQCLCTHLTSFSSSFIIPPAPLDFSYIFANAGFLDNITIYVTCIVSYVFFTLIFIWARRKDKKNEIMVGMIPLTDNSNEDRYFYEVTVVTADRLSSATNSKVSFIISGSDNDTSVRTFDKIDRPIFRRGAVDKFLMSTRRDLGNLETVRIWHDNSGKGKLQSWFLNSIIIRNIITGKTHHFIFNNWLSLTDGDGLVVRSSFAATTSQIKGFGHLFGGHARKAIRDDHLWFSVFLRPPESNFTCMQRAVCCMMVMWLEMLVNIMWYKSMPPPEATTSINIGPITVTTAEIGVGIMSNLIVLPVSVLVIALFKNARRRSRFSVFAKIMQQRLKEKEASDQSLVDLENVTLSKDKKGTGNDTTHQPQTDTLLNKSDIKRRRRKKKKTKLFPWWAIIPAWFLAVSAILAATVFVIFYAIQMGNEEALAWLTSLLVSMFFGILLTQPIKGLVIAMVIASICKSPVQESDDEENDEDIPDDIKNNNEAQSENDNQQTNDTTISASDGLAKTKLEKKRKQRLYEMKLDSVLIEIFIHCTFVIIAFVICYSEFDPNAYKYKSHLENTFVKASSTGILPFDNLSHPGNFWPWMMNIFLPAVYAPSLFNSTYLDNSDDILADEMSYILGYPVLRQLRIKPEMCSLHETIANFSRECNIAYSILNEDTANYGPHWETFNETDVSNQFIYRDASKINGFPFVAKHAVYSGGGYVYKMKGRMRKIQDRLKFLIEQRWFDQYTRALFIEIFLYNPQVNLFASITLLLEVLPTGGAYPHYRIDVIRLFPNTDNFMYINLVCKFIYLLFVGVFCFKEIKNIINQKKKYFRKISNMLEFIIVLLALFAAILFFMRMKIVNSIVKEIEDKDGSGHVNLALAVYFNDIFSCLLGFILFFGTVKFLKILRFNEFIAIFLKMFQHSAMDLLSYFLFLWIIFIAFTSLFYITFLTILEDYSSFIVAAESIIDNIMGNFDFETIRSSYKIIGPIYLFSLLTSFMFFFFNMFLAIMIEAYEVICGQVVLEFSASDLWMHLVKKFKWKKSPKPDKDNLENDDNHLANSIDMLLMHVTNMHMHELQYSIQIDHLEKSNYFHNRKVDNSFHPSK